MRRYVILAAVCLTGASVVPAHANPVSLNAACEKTVATLSSTGGTVGSVVFAGSRFAVGNRVVQSGIGTYGILAEEGLRAKDRKTALGYLKAPTATAWLNSGRFFSTSWTTSYPAAVTAAAGLPTDCSATAGGLLSSSGITYAYAHATVEIVDGAVTRWNTTPITFGAQSVNAPSGKTVPYASWLKASQAASLDATLRTITRTVAAEVDDPSRDSIDEAVRAAIDPDRAVPLTVRTLRSGALVSARNPYTKTYHAWRVYVKDGEPLARRVAP